MRDDKVIAGALFDFLGWATSQPETLRLGCSELVPPAIDALTKWATLRGLSLEEADVKGWNEAI
jgi:hypothetical protein